MQQQIAVAYLLTLEEIRNIINTTVAILFADFFPPITNNSVLMVVWIVLLDIDRFLGGDRV